MSDSTPRPHVMALLFDMNFKSPKDSMVFRHLNGRLFTKEEPSPVAQPSKNSRPLAPTFTTLRSGPKQMQPH
ncbi:hypothetical protein [Streptomyces sp. BE133]|uniref:hypothetical protein n=1 Tax=Streptomyces sp. BE133 TaxID=3002523 RepID=UPI002E78BAF0|nr:hypothetical protein [Streptomyces sp. BE133]MEE1810799.1 hypothetical protein [Streptomyces sp. BE133]